MLNLITVKRKKSATVDEWVCGCRVEVRRGESEMREISKEYEAEEK